MSNNSNKHQIHYDLLVQKAMRGVIRDILARIRDEGLPGDHHFYIVFNTQAPGVQISPRLQQQYPDEMTIVMQHQYWGFEVKNSHFTVKLSFNGITEPLVIPYNAIKAFVDPSVPYGFQLSPIDDEPYIEDNTDVLYEEDTPELVDQTLIDNALLQDLLDSENIDSIQQNNQGNSKPPVTLHIPDASISHPPKISALRPASKNEELDETLEDNAKKEKGTNNIVRLDAFRKKS